MISYHFSQNIYCNAMCIYVCVYVCTCVGAHMFVCTYSFIPRPQRVHSSTLWKKPTRLNVWIFSVLKL